jgi:hypothetical protein
MLGGHATADSVEKQPCQQARIDDIAAALAGDLVLTVLALRPFKDIGVNNADMLTRIVLAPMVHLADVGSLLD